MLDKHHPDSFTIGVLIMKIVDLYLYVHVHKLIVWICRKRLFSLINDLPTLFDVVTGRKPIKDNKPSSDSGSKSRNGGTKVVHWKNDITFLFFDLYIFRFLSLKTKNGVWLQRSIEGQPKNTTPKLMEERYEEEEDEEEEDEHGDTLCGSCGGNYTQDEFWIGCDVCERWYHGKCVKITPAKADSIKQYKCPPCCAKKGRQWLWWSSSSSSPRETCSHVLILIILFLVSLTF